MPERLSAEKNQNVPSFVPGRVGIVGLGLMGGSFAKAAYAAGQEVYGWNRNKETLATALDTALTGELTDDILPTCELLILAGYPQVSINWLQEMARHISPNALVIDTVGVKRVICDECSAIARRYPWTFIGCHPMAGTQYSGFAHARANMFHGAPMVVVPPLDMGAEEQTATLERLKKLLEPAGFGSYTLSTAEFHDEQIAYTSQLAHVVSNAYVKSPAAQAHKGFSAGSYKDLTRVARLNADMWCELFLDNADNLSHEIGILIDSLSAYKEAIDAHDPQTLTALLAEGDRLKKEAERK